MNQTIRHNTFETNSSSTHSFTYSRNFSKIYSLVDDARELLRDINHDSEIYEALAKLQTASKLIIDELGSGDYKKLQNSDYDD